jgi:hypothetical protein
MIDVSKIEAEKIATNHVAGTRYRCRGFEGTVLEVRFGDHEDLPRQWVSASELHRHVRDRHR